MDVLKFAKIGPSFTLSAKEDIVIPDVYSSELMMHHLTRDGDRILLIDAASHEQMSVDDVRKEATGIALSLMDIGLSSIVCAVTRLAMPAPYWASSSLA